MSQRAGWVCAALALLLGGMGLYALLVGRFMLPVEAAF